MFSFVGADWDAATWASVGTWVTAFIYVAIGLIAWRQLSEAARLRREQTRPFVIVDIEPRPDQMLMLTITNLGPTIARNVTLTFSPPLSSTFSKPWPWEKSPLFSDGIPTLPPNKKYQCHFDIAFNRIGSDLPGSYVVDARYDGSRPVRRPIRFWKMPTTEYDEQFVLDISRFDGMAPPPKSIPALVAEVEKIREEMHRWTDGIDGLRVYNINRDKQIRVSERHFWISKADAVRKEHGLVAFLQYLVERALQRRGWLD